MVPSLLIVMTVWWVPSDAPSVGWLMVRKNCSLPSSMLSESMRMSMVPWVSLGSTRMLESHRDSPIPSANPHVPDWLVSFFRLPGTTLPPRRPTGTHPSDDGREGLPSATESGSSGLGSEGHDPLAVSGRIGQEKRGAGPWFQRFERPLRPAGDETRVARS